MGNKGASVAELGFELMKSTNENVMTVLIDLHIKLITKKHLIYCFWNILMLIFKHLTKLKLKLKMNIKFFFSEVLSIMEKIIFVLELFLQMVLFGIMMVLQQAKIVLKIVIYQL